MERIEKSYGVKPIYDFISFSKNTRIGVLEKGESFLEFSNNFMKDLKKILSKTDEQFDIGVVIQRITPSKYSFAILDKEELTQNVDLRNLDVADFIARLAADHVPQEEQASVIKLEKDINLLEILNGYSIYDIIKVENDEFDDKERKILELDSIKTEILAKFKSSFGTKNLRELALELDNKRIDKKEISEIVRDILEKRFSEVTGLKRPAIPRATLFSKRFPDILEHLALLWRL